MYHNLDYRADCRCSEPGIDEIELINGRHCSTIGGNIHFSFSYSKIYREILFLQGISLVLYTTNVITSSGHSWILDGELTTNVRIIFSLKATMLL